MLWQPRLHCYHSLVASCLEVKIKMHGCLELWLVPWMGIWVVWDVNDTWSDVFFSNLPKEEVDHLGNWVDNAQFHHKLKYPCPGRAAAMRLEPHLLSSCSQPLPNKWPITSAHVWLRQVVIPTWKIGSHVSTLVGGDRRDVPLILLHNFQAHCLQSVRGSIHHSPTHSDKCVVSPLIDWWQWDIIPILLLTNEKERSATSHYPAPA